MSAKLHQLRGLLDAFRGGLDPERVRELRDRVDDRGRAFARQQIVDEAPVDL
jgi:hypothetical protein